MYSSHSLLIMEGLRKKNVETEKVDFFFFFLKECLQLWQILYFHFSVSEGFHSLLTTVASFP